VSSTESSSTSFRTSDLGLDARNGLVPLRAIGCVVSRRRDLHHLGLAPRHQLRKRGSAAIDAALAPRSRLAGAHGDRVEPGLRGGIPSKEMPFAVGLEEDVLHDILGVGGVAAELARKPVDPPSGALDERLNRRGCRRVGRDRRNGCCAGKALVR
jgi:hypothetical protein